ncbi:MAG: hypothetical protein JW943_00015, partial [Deltaproteobacteria bacterium]|nr:hypothetical protein [Deltaproteobacteria bacterium]
MKTKIRGNTFFAVLIMVFCMHAIFGGLCLAIADGEGALTDIIITPSLPTMQVGQSVTFTAEGRDQSGNPVAIQDPHWEAEYGTITPVPGSDPPQCTYTAAMEGNGYILCYQGPPSQGGVNGSTDITIQSGGGASISVYPGQANLLVGQTQAFTATGFTADGAAVVINPVWTATGGTITQGGVYSANNPSIGGDFTVTATATINGSSVSGSATVHTIRPEDLQSINVTPSSVSMTAGHQMLFQAEGKDQAGNTYTVDPTWSASGGTID